MVHDNQVPWLPANPVMELFVRSPCQLCFAARVVSSHMGQLQNSKSASSQHGQVSTVLHPSTRLCWMLLVTRTCLVETFTSTHLCFGHVWDVWNVTDVCNACKASNDMLGPTRHCALTAGMLQGGNDDDVVPAGGQTPFTPSTFLTLSTTPQSAVRGAPADDISIDNASAACTASAHSLSAAEAAALEFDTSIALGSNVQSQADVPATAAHADSVAVSSGSMTQDSHNSISAPAPAAAGQDTNISLASHPIACTEDQPSPDDQSISAPLASHGLQLSRDSQTAGETGKDQADCLW